MRVFFNQFLDFLYVIIQRRLSSARYLGKMGLGLLLLGSPSLLFKFSRGDLSLLIDTSSAPQPEIILTSIMFLGFLCILLSIFIELKERFFGEAVSMKRAKSIDLRSLKGAAAPTLADSFTSTIETTGLHQDLFLWQERTQTTQEWLMQCSNVFMDFSDNSLQRLNSFEPQKPLALGAIAHVPHCFVLGFLVGNKRLTNFYCWQRNTTGKDSDRWIDCRDARSRGQELCVSETLINSDIDNDDLVRCVGISIEISMSNDIDVFMSYLKLDRAVRYEVMSKSIGNMFSDREQVNLVDSIRVHINELNKKYKNMTELHLTIMGQCSLVMRLGAEFNQNHFNFDIYIQHFQNNSYPWALVIKNLITTI